MKTLIARPLLTLYCSLCCLLAAAEGSELDRRDFGNNTLPLWAPLSDFEQHTISHHALAEAADAQALLALYLLASGDVRSNEDFEHYLQQLHRGLAALPLPRASADNARTTRRLAEALHNGLHTHFYALDTALSESNSLLAYDAEQSQLSHLFNSGIFNCISSTLLYAVAARELDLQVHGILLPSHALIQLTLPGGEVINIETTASDGFDTVHDEDYYARNTQWFEARDLPAPRYEDFQQRRIVSLAELGLENMWNQHVAAERMDYIDRLRLAEIRGYLLPYDPQAQKNRMLYYTREFDHLTRQQDTDSLLRLFALIDAYIDAMVELADHPDARDDDEFYSLLAWLQTARANALILGPAPEPGLLQARALLENINPDWQDPDAIRHNLFIALSRYAERRMASQAYAQAREAFAGIEADCASHELCRNTLTRVYAEWASFYWQFEDWPLVTDVYQQYLTLSLTGEQSVLIQQNLAAAYYNWAEQQWRDEDRDGAIARLEQCLSVLPEAELCSDRHAAMRTAHQGW